MKGINKIVLSLTLLCVLVIIQGCGADVDDKKKIGKNKSEQINNEKSETKEINKTKGCKEEYENLLNKNKKDFSDCNFSASSDSFEKEDINEKKNNTVLIFDASGSMAGLIGNKKKIDIAKEALYNFVDKIEGENVNLSVVVYGHKGSNSTMDKDISCKGIEEIYYMGKVSDASVIKNKIKNLQPTGWTPIAGAFKKAKEILSKYEGKNNNNSIVLISDGKEMCGGDPIEEIKKLKASNLNITANVIGFDVEGEDEQQLKKVAQNGGGDYFSVKNSVDLENALAKHEEFMREFDHKMGNITMQLNDMGEFGEKYFQCMMKLKEEESNIILDMYGHDEDEKGIVSEKCTAYSEEKYYKERYNKLESELNMKFDDVMADWKKANAFNK